MLDIKVLGPGCHNCDLLEKRVKEALAVLGIQGTIQHVTDRQQYPKYHLIYPPGLVIKEKLVSGGRVPEISEIINLLSKALAQTQQKA